MMTFFLQTITVKELLKISPDEHPTLRPNNTCFKLFVNLFLWLPQIQCMFCFNKDIFCHLNSRLYIRHSTALMTHGSQLYLCFNIFLKVNTLCSHITSEVTTNAVPFLF